MNTQQKQNDLMKYVRLFRARWWMVVLPAVVLGPMATLYSMRLPDKFRSSTVILVTPQKVPSSFVTSTVTADIQDRLSTIRQQVLSRTALETVIQELGLFPKQRSERTMEEVVELMRKDISITVARDGREANSFGISFSYQDPRLAMQVAGKLATLFIDGNLKAREQQAIGTTQFLGDEIERYRAEVRSREEEIYAFRRKYMHESPDQLVSNQARLTELQNRMQINATNLNAAKDRKIILQQQLSDIEKRVQDERERRVAEAREAAERASAGGEPGIGSRGGLLDQRPALSAQERELERQREELARLRATHTERHPDVVRLAASVRRLEEESAREKRASAQPSASSESPRGRDMPAPSPRVEYPPTYDQIKTDILRAEAEVSRTIAENFQLQRTIEGFQSRIAAVPQRQLELQQLSEGYNNVKAVLERLTDNKLQADMASNMEVKQKGEQFKVLDPASLPDKPVAPNRLRLVAAGFLGGGGFGAGLVLLLDLLNRGFRSREDAAEVLGIPVLGVIPNIVSPADVQRRRKLCFWGSGLSAAILLSSALIVHVAVKPIPLAFGEFYEEVKKTHWTAMR
jgi:polysaccharide chain length determinant protein (PEP-CTERM system associated)